MDPIQLVDQRLHKIHKTRNRVGYLPNLLSLYVSVYFQSSALVYDTRWFLAIIFVTVGTLFRVIVNEILFDKFSAKVKWVLGLNVVAFLLLGLGWGMHFADIHHHFGPEAPNVAYTLLIIVAFITGSSTSLLGDKVSYYVFVNSLALSVIFVFLTQPKLSTSYIVLNVFLYMIFSISNYKIAHRQLRELLESQIKLEQEKERLSQFMNTVPGFVGVIDRNLVCYMANKATLMLYPEIIGKKLGNLDPNSDWEKTVIDFIKSDKLVDISEQKTVFNGEDIYALLNVQKLDDGGAIIVSIITTELVLAQKKLREQEAASQYTAKLASLGEMAAGIAHEVNNPLTIIQGSANIVRRLVDQDPIDISNVKLLTTKMIETCERISKTVKSLKALSRNGENDPMTAVSIHDVLDQTLDISEGKLRREGVEIRVGDISPDLKVSGREVQLSQVMINLISNAIDAIKNQQEKWIEIKIQKKNGFFDILVVDSGHGIPAHLRQKIMEPFFTTKDVNQGTGLGLSISKTIIHDHGGELTLLPDEPHTTFRIRLPVMHA